MTMVGRQETLKKIDECAVMPSIPQIIVRVREISEDPKSSVADLANIVLSDHTLTSKILRIANSAFYAEYANKVSTVTQAITLMGFRTVQNVVISLALYDTMKGLGEHKQFDFCQFWTRSLSTGVIGKLIASAARYKSSEEAFIAGFMHDIGTAILATVFPEEYAVVVKRIAGGEDQIFAERTVFGADHTEIGGHLARKWNLPPVLSRPITDHHRMRMTARQKSPHVLVDFVYLSDLVYDALSIEDSEENQELMRGTYQACADLAGISEVQTRRIMELAPNLIREIAKELDISVRTHDGVSTGKVAAIHEFQPGLNDVAELLHERNRELAIMHETGEAIRRAQTEDEIIQITLEAAIRGMGIGKAILFKIDPEAQVAIGILGFGVDSQQSVYEMRLPTNSGVIGETVTNRQAHTILDVQSPIYAQTVTAEEQAALKLRSFVILPLEVNSQVDMVMVMSNPDSSEPVNDDRVHSITGVVNQAMIAIERLRLRKEIEQYRAREVDNLVQMAFKA